MTYLCLGDRSSEIRFDPGAGVWNWTDWRRPGKYAIIEKPLKSMLMGRAVADFTNIQVMIIKLTFQINSHYLNSKKHQIQILKN